MLINDLAGTGLLVGNSSQSPESGVRTHAVPSKIFRRVTEYAGTPSYSSSSTACPGMADRAREIATITTILIHFIASSPFPKTSSRRCTTRHLPARWIGKKLYLFPGIRWVAKSVPTTSSGLITRLLPVERLGDCLCLFCETG